MRVKHLITAGLFLLSFPLIGKVSASEISSGVDLYYVGKTIDVGMAKDTSDYKAGISIFKEDYYNKLNPKNSPGGSKGISYVVCEKSQEKFYNEIKAKVGLSLGLGANVEGFTLGANKGFNLSAELRSVKSVSDMYLDYHQEYHYTDQLINDYHSDDKRQEMKNNLRQEYIDDLNKVSSRKMSYKQFFNKYGTHLIAECELGTKLDVYAKYSSYGEEFDSNICAEFSSNSDVALDKIANISRNFSASIFGKYQYDQSSISYSVTAYPYGSSALTITDLSTIDERISEWNNGAQKNPYILGFKEDTNYDGCPDGLIPLYDLLPNNSNISSSKMKSEMASYIIGLYKDPEDLVDDNFLFEDGFKKVIIPSDSSMIYTITDSGKKNQPHDMINILNEIGYSADILKKRYKYFTFDVKLEKYCKNSGYKRTYLYNTNIGDNMYELVAKHEFTGKCSTYEDYSYNTINEMYIEQYSLPFLNSFSFIEKGPQIYKGNDKNKIKIENLTNVMNVVYSAAGSGTDTWKNVNRKYTFTFYKQ